MCSRLSFKYSNHSLLIVDLVVVSRQYRTSVAYASAYHVNMCYPKLSSNGVVIFGKSSVLLFGGQICITWRPFIRLGDFGRAKAFRYLTCFMIRGVSLHKSGSYNARCIPYVRVINCYVPILSSVGRLRTKSCRGGIDYLGRYTSTYLSLFLFRLSSVYASRVTEGMWMRVEG